MAEAGLFRPVQPVRAYERIVEQVEEAVYSGALPPGARLPSERDMMVAFSVSRSTVREALRVLDSGGVVRSRPGDPRGPEVLPVSDGGLRKQLTRLIRGDEIGLGDLLAFRMVLEGSANFLAAAMRTDGELGRMDDAMAVMRSAVDEGYEAFSAADVAFHDAVAEVSHNALLRVCSEVVRGIVLNLIAGKIESSPDRRALMSESLAHHGEVLDAVRRGDGRGAAHLARANLFDYYADYCTPDERSLLRTLVDELPT